MPAFAVRVFHFLSFVYFLTHIPITLFLDSQVVLPRGLYPSWATALLDGFIADYGDPLTLRKPTWFKALVAVECSLQLPFFFVAVYAYVRKRNWIRIPMVVYGAHVATTMVPILGELLEHASKAANSAEATTRRQLIAIYMPYLIMPLLLTAFMCAHSTPFPEDRAAVQPTVRRSGKKSQ